MLQTSASISPGSSGSPVINNRGEVLGLISFFFRDAQNINYAIACNSLKIFGLVNNIWVKEIKPRQEENQNKEDILSTGKILDTFRSNIFSFNDSSIQKVDIIVNIIFAGRGYRFKKPDILNIFKEFSWYKPDTSNESVVKSRMDNFELKNLDLLLKRRKTLQHLRK